MPATDEYVMLMRELIPDIGEGSRIGTPLSGVRFHQVSIGRNVIVVPGCLMMSAGGIRIDDDASIAANVQIISNNHDLYERHVITCKAVHIGKTLGLEPWRPFCPVSPSVKTRL